ncbi:MAG: type I DNA topoisomerase, partial [Patescibacteria group bacterium]
MNLIIVESPTKARTLSNFLTGDFVVKATKGHIKDLPKSILGVDIDNHFSPDYQPVVKSLEAVKEIQDAASKAQHIFLATDPDREGEAIAQHVLEMLRSNDQFLISNDKVNRIVFHEITKEAVDQAIKNPHQLDKNLVDAQMARRVLDRLVGYKLSPLLWKKVRRGLSAGRVQTVTVRLIVEREREIEAFKKEEYWEIFAQVKSLRLKVESEFIVYLIKVDDKKAEIKNKNAADKILLDLNKASYKVLTVKKREVRKNPYSPFTTSTMTQAGARIFGWSAKKTMSTSQQLYEQGLITYHRTDSTNISIQALEKVRSFIAKEYGNNYLPENPRIYKVRSKVAQEAHEAIRPTSLDGISNFPFGLAQGEQFPISNQFSNDSKKLYELIWKRFVACQMAASVYDETVIEVQATSVYLLRASGQIVKFDGWRRVVPRSSQSEVGSSELPEVEEGESLQLIKVWGDQKFTEPPARYNEASLIKTLEKLGIGRPSTYAPTISTIQIRSYVEKKDANFFPTPVGEAVNDFLTSNFPDVFEYQFTASMEDDLDNVANGKKKWELMMHDFWQPFAKKLIDVEKNSKRVKIETEKLGRACPECKRGELVIRIGR